MEILKKFFESKGYNVVALPKTTIKPLQLLVKNKNILNSLGNKINDLFEEDEAPLPAVFRNKTIPEFTGKTQVTFQLDTGITLLEGLLKNLKLGNISANSEFSKTDKVVFSFENVLEDGIKGFLDLDKYISGSIPKIEDFKSYKKNLEKNELFIITSVLKCNDFSVKVVDKNAQNITGDLDIEKTVTVNAELKREKDSSFKIAYKGKEKLVFAFKAVKIIYDAPKWFQFWNENEIEFRIKADTGWTLMGEEDFPITHLKLNDSLAKF